LLQSSTRYVLTNKKNVCAVVAVLLHKCRWGVVANCRKLFVIGHVLTELFDEMLCFHWVGCRGQYHTGNSQGLAVY
jgi:hypothetical protein